MRQLILVTAMLASLSAAAVAEPTDEQMTTFSKDAQHVANCEAVAANQIRLNLTTAMVISMTTPDEDTKKTLVSFYSERAQTAAKLMQIGDQVLKKMAGDVGLDPEQLIKESDKIVNQTDVHIATALINASLDPRHMAMMLAAMQHDLGGCTQWLGEKVNAPK